MNIFVTYRISLIATVFALISLISGCATTPNSKTLTNKEVTIQSEQPISETNKEKNKKSIVERPKIKLTEDILFKVLIAEIAGHRGKIDTATNYYLDLARKTLDPAVIERATRIAVYARNDVASYEAASLWVDVDPKNPDPHQILTVMYLRQNNLNEALRHLEIILDASEGEFDQKLWMVANFLGGEEDKSMVIKLMENLMDKHMNDVDALYAYAHVSSRMGDIKRAESLFEKILELKPENEGCNHGLYSLVTKKGRY